MGQREEKWWKGAGSNTERWPVGRTLVNAVVGGEKLHPSKSKRENINGVEEGALKK